jgi:hypothetical protein
VICEALDLLAKIHGFAPEVGLALKEDEALKEDDVRLSFAHFLDRTFYQPWWSTSWFNHSDMLSIS